MDQNVASPPDFDEGFEARWMRLPQIALEADELAAQLRKKYKVPKRNDEKYNPIEYINKAKAKISEIEKSGKSH